VRDEVVALDGGLVAMAEKSVDKHVKELTVRNGQECLASVFILLCHIPELS
jgi:hypothetical protein